jgi:hypothetical protein
MLALRIGDSFSAWSLTIMHNNAALKARHLMPECRLYEARRQRGAAGFLAAPTLSVAQ